MSNFSTAIHRRYRRMRRRRKIGRAYDMALEVARVLPRNGDVLDVGCGNGFIAHHLTGLLNARVTGLDVAQETTANINYQSYDGRHFPVSSNSFNAVLLCYVLHHAADTELLLGEVQRVLRHDGVVVIYEDLPISWWDRMVCWQHEMQWRSRTGPCTFHLDHDWREVFRSSGFEITQGRRLSRWRNLAHPVARHFYVLKRVETAVRQNSLKLSEAA